MCVYVSTQISHTYGHEGKAKSIEVAWSTDGLNGLKVKDEVTITIQDV